MRSRSVVTLVAVAILSLAGTSSLTAAEDADGKALFIENKCNLCHSIDSQGIEKKSKKMKGPDLSDAGNMVSDAAWLKGFLLKEEEKDGKKHKKEFKGEEAELDALIEWVMSLKKS